MFFIGTCFGSFINMLGYRTEVKYNLRILKFKNLAKQQRSVCDFCGKQLHWYENIRVFSWIFLKGKTKCCHNPLPWEYPIVEISTGILFLSTYYVLRITSYEFYIGLIIITLLVFSFVFDLKYMILPDFSTYILIVSALIIWGTNNLGNWNYIISGLAAGLFLLALHVGTKGKGLGMGDVKLAVFMGLFLGYPKIILAFYIAFIVGAIVGLTMMGLKKASRKSMIPFGPFLIGGTYISWLFGDLIIKGVKLFL